MLQEMTRCSENVASVDVLPQKQHHGWRWQPSVIQTQVSFGLCSLKLKVMWLHCLNLHLWTQLTVILHRSAPFGSVLVTRSVHNEHLEHVSVPNRSAVCNRHMLDWWSAEAAAVRLHDFRWHPSFLFLCLTPSPPPLLLCVPIFPPNLVIAGAVSTCFHSWDVEIMKWNDCWLMACPWSLSIFYFEVYGFKSIQICLWHQNIHELQ